MQTSNTQNNLLCVPQIFSSLVVFYFHCYFELSSDKKSDNKFTEESRYEIRILCYQGTCFMLTYYSVSSATVSEH